MLPLSCKEKDTAILFLYGTVFRVNSGNYYVQTDDRDVVICHLRGNLKKELVYSTSLSRPKRVDSAKKRRSTDPIAVGDRVTIDPSQKMIEEILPRHSDLSRDSPSQRGQHTLVANLDCLFLVFAAAEPLPNFWLVDRFLVMAEAAEIDAAIIINKTDLVEGGSEAARELFATYAKIGYSLYPVSAHANIGLEPLRDALRGQISAFAGPSGVGKSSLLNSLFPGLTLKVGDIGYVTYKGRHTTTSAELVPLGEGEVGWVADTPGLRQVEFWEIDKEDIPFCFPEFAPFLGQCRFADCRHHDETGCAVRAAVESGEIDRRRYQSYRQMTE